MRQHLLECASCAQSDASIRRALMLARNLPEIRPSDDFAMRLRQRLAAEQQHGLVERPRDFRGPGMRAFVAVAASIVGIGFIAARSLDWSGPAREVAIEPVMVSQPAPALAPPPITTPAFVSSMSAGVSVWPVLYLAEQAPIHFARAQFDQATGAQ